MGLPGRSYFLDSTYAKYLQAYRVFLLEVATILGASLPVAVNDVDKLIEFETNLAQIMTPNEDRRNITEFYHKKNVKFLQEFYPQIDWVKYLSNAIGRDIKLDDDIALYCMDYLFKLLNLLNYTSPRYGITQGEWTHFTMQKSPIPLIITKISYLNHLFQDCR